MKKPSTAVAPPAPQAPPAPPAPDKSPPRPVGDLASYIEARRRARGDPARAEASIESETERANRQLAADIAAEQQARKAKDDPNQGGGLFQVRRIGYDDAEFLFFGWSKEAQRRQSQMIEVRRGNYPNIRVAIVRRMIEIIRDHEQGDFLWESRRLGRYVTLSARPADDAGLQAFLMQEFFPGER
jgi:pyruvate/2-oxoglutarate dehydrogenase complex dihydrolipoamide acyltransferase (E2) component